MNKSVPLSVMLYVIFLCIFYCLLVFYFYLSAGVKCFFYFKGIYIFQKILFLLFPIYIFIFWRMREEIVLFDFIAVFIPIIFWFILNLIMGGKSGTNFFIVEPSIVIAISTLYSLRFYLSKIFNKFNANSIGILLLILICILVLILYITIPPLNE